MPTGGISVWSGAGNGGAGTGATSQPRLPSELPGANPVTVLSSAVRGGVFVQRCGRRPVQQSREKDGACLRQGSPPCQGATLSEGAEGSGTLAPLIEGVPGVLALTSRLCSHVTDGKTKIQSG